MNDRSQATVQRRLTRLAGTPADLRSPVRYLIGLARANTAAITLGSIFAIGWTVTQGVLPGAVGRGIQLGLIGRDAGALVTWGLIVLALGVVQAVSATLQDRCALVVRVESAYLTVLQTVRQADRLGAALSRKVAIGDVVSVGVRDITNIGDAMEMFTRAVGAALAVMVIAALMLSISIPLGVLVLIGVPLTLVTTALLIRALHGRQEALRAHQQALTERAIDIMRGIKVLRGVGGEAHIATRYAEESGQVRTAAVAVARVDSTLAAAKLFLPGLMTAIIVTVGARRVLERSLDPGQLVAFYGYAVFLTVPLRRLTLAFSNLVKARVAAGHVLSILRLEAPEYGTAHVPGSGTLVDLQSGLVIEPGTFTAVACTTPAEAAELADRLAGYTDGSVRYADRTLPDYERAGMRRAVLLGDAEAYLFEGTLRQELDPYDRSGTADDLLHRAVWTAAADDIVGALPDGLDAVNASGGVEFSGGQRQRLRLARAIAADPDVLILVEPTNAVDAHTEARVAERLRDARRGRTTVVLTVSPALLGLAERVVFVADGRVTGDDTHDQLLRDDRYRRLVARELAVE